VATILGCVFKTFKLPPHEHFDASARKFTIGASGNKAFAEILPVSRLI
jgi:hypothetical protein